MNLHFDRDRADDTPAALHQLAGAYALGALPDEKRVVFEAWLEAQADPATRAEVAELVATAALLAAEAAEPPPAGLRDAVLAMADQTRQLPPPVVDLAAARDRRRPTWVRRATLAVGGVAAAGALVLGTATVVQGDLDARIDELERDLAADRELRSVVTAADAEVRHADGQDASVVLSASEGRAVFTAGGLAPAPDGRTYQLWLVRTDGPTSAGLFDAALDGVATRSVAADLSDVVAFAVTLEPDRGSTSPTSDPVVVVTL